MVALAAAATVLLIAVMLISELHHTPKGEYGRLVDREMPKTNVITRHVEVVNEAPVATPAAQPQQLLADADAAPAVTAVRPTAQSRVVIVGGADGVAIQRRNAPVRHLTGGFGRQSLQ